MRKIRVKAQNEVASSKSRETAKNPRSTVSPARPWDDQLVLQRQVGNRVVSAARLAPPTGDGGVGDIKLAGLRLLSPTNAGSPGAIDRQDPHEQPAAHLEAFAAEFNREF